MRFQHLTNILPLAAKPLKHTIFILQIKQCNDVITIFILLGKQCNVEITIFILLNPRKGIAMLLSILEDRQSDEGSVPQRKDETVYQPETEDDF